MKISVHVSRDFLPLRNTLVPNLFSNSLHDVSCQSPITVVIQALMPHARTPCSHSAVHGSGGERLTGTDIFVPPSRSKLRLRIPLTSMAMIIIKAFLRGS